MIEDPYPDKLHYAFPKTRGDEGIAFADWLGDTFQRDHILFERVDNAPYLEEILAKQNSFIDYIREKSTVRVQVSFKNIEDFALCRMKHEAQG